MTTDKDVTPKELGKKPIPASEVYREVKRLCDGAVALVARMEEWGPDPYVNFIQGQIFAVGKILSTLAQSYKSAGLDIEEEVPSGEGQHEQTQGGEGSPL